MKSYIHKIKVSANVGLIGSIAVIVIAIIFRYCPLTFGAQSEPTARTMLIIGVVAALLDMLLIMNGIRRTTPRLRQENDLEKKLQGYASMVQTCSTCTLVMTAFECIIIVLLGNYNLLMIAMLMVLMLFFTYPNMYKVKVDLGLDDTQMKSLFGDDYIADPVEAEEAEEVDTNEKQDE